MNDKPSSFTSLQAEDARAERRLVWAELLALLMISAVVGALVWLIRS